MRPLAASRIVSPTRARALVVAGATASIVTAANASQGAYFSQSWGWVALAFLMPTTIQPRLLVPVGTLTAWIALSSLWSISPAGSMREVEQRLVYLTVALALAFVRRGSRCGHQVWRPGGAPRVP